MANKLLGGSDSPLPTNLGGTGATTPAGARTNLGAVNIAGDTMTGPLILYGAPTVNLEAATKEYVDAVSAGFNFKEPCFTATTGNLAGYVYANGAAGVGATLTAGSNGAFSNDGTSPALNARVLVKDQTTTFENGIFRLSQVGTAGTPAILTRTTDYDTPAEIQPGDFIIVTNGTTNLGSAWLETATVATIGTDPITFTQFGAGGFAPSNATYIVQTASGALSNEQALAALATGIVKNTTATGVLSIAVQGTDYYAPGGTDVAMADGGSGKSLVAANGGIVYTDADSMEILAPTATALQMLQSGANAAPTWSTATYPASTTINRILYSSANNVVNQITTANDGILVTSATGVPSIGTALPNGITATTQAGGDNTTKVATTAFVTSAVAGGITLGKAFYAANIFGR